MYPRTVSVRGETLRLRPSRKGRCGSDVPQAQRFGAWVQLRQLAEPAIWRSYQSLYMDRLGGWRSTTSRLRRHTCGRVRVVSWRRAGRRQAGRCGSSALRTPRAVARSQPNGSRVAGSALQDASATARHANLKSQPSSTAYRPRFIRCRPRSTQATGSMFGSTSRLISDG